MVSVGRSRDEHVQYITVPRRRTDSTSSKLGVDVKTVYPLAGALATVSDNGSAGHLGCV